MDPAGGVQKSARLCPPAAAGLDDHACGGRGAHCGVVRARAREAKILQQQNLGPHTHEHMKRTSTEQDAMLGEKAKNYQTVAN